MLDAVTIAAVREVLREILPEALAHAGVGAAGKPLMTVGEVAEFLRTTPKA